MKPWADCETDDQRLDVHNGLLLAAHLDAGLISFETLYHQRSLTTTSIASGWPAYRPSKACDPTTSHA